MVAGTLKKLNGTTVATPTDFFVDRFKLTKAGRVGSGKMTIELIAKKHKLYFVYEVISGTDLEILYGIIFSDDSFVTCTFIENGVEYTKTLYVGPIHAEQFRAQGIWYWKNLTFNLIEQ